MGYKVAVVGATGAVGREMLQTLSERKFPADEVFALASEKSTGKEISYGEDGVIKVTSLDKFDFSIADIALFSAGGELSKAYAPRAGQEGCLVIDNSSAFRMDPNVPLIVPEVNPDTLKQAKPENKGKNIIANPNCSTAQLVIALKPLHDLFIIKRIVVSTYQSVSGGGKAPMDELIEQTKLVLDGKKVSSKNFTKQIAFNAIPHIDLSLIHI